MTNWLIYNNNIIVKRTAAHFSDIVMGLSSAGRFFITKADAFAVLVVASADAVVEYLQTWWYCTFKNKLLVFLLLLICCKHFNEAKLRCCVAIAHLLNINLRYRVPLCLCMLVSRCAQC